MHVNAVINDMGTNFTQLANCLGVMSENPKFTVNEKDIYYVFDPCHLIKATRNNLLKNVFSANNRKSSWSFTEKFYELEEKQFYRSARKLMGAHIRPNNFEKMRVRLTV